MNTGALSVRARLTLWHAVVLTLVVCLFAAGILLFVRARFYSDLDLQLSRELATVDRIYREEPGELTDLASQWGITYFQIVEGSDVRHRTEGWEREGLAQALRDGDTAPVSWMAPDGRPYRVQKISSPSYYVAAAIDETSIRHTLWTLAAILTMGIPFAVGLAIGGGYFL